MTAFAEFIVPGCISDHFCCIIYLDNQVVNINKRFKFFNMWTINDKFLDIVSRSWERFEDGTKQFVLKQKLTKLKQPLKQLNNKHFSHISSRAKVAKMN